MKIKPCPFCGRPAEVKLINGFWKVVCDGESCPYTHKYISRDIAIKEWNTRTKPQKEKQDERLD